MRNLCYRILFLITFSVVAMSVRLLLCLCLCLIQEEILTLAEEITTKKSLPSTRRKGLAIFLATH